MYEPIVDTSGPNLGTLTVWTRTIDTSDQLVMTPVWRLSNGHGPSWHFGQAQVTTDTSFQVRHHRRYCQHVDNLLSSGDH